MSLVAETVGASRLTPTTENDAVASCESSLSASTPPTSITDDAASFDSAPMSPKPADTADTADTVAIITPTAVTVVTTTADTVDNSDATVVEDHDDGDSFHDALDSQPAPAHGNAATSATSATPVTKSAVSSARPQSPSLALVIPSMPQTESQSSSPDGGELVRPRRPRASVGTYNLARLSGTAGHGKRLANGDIISARSIRRRSAAAAAGSRGGPADGDANRFDTPTRASTVQIHSLDIQWRASPLTASGEKADDDGDSTAATDAAAAVAPKAQSSRITKAINKFTQSSKPAAAPKPTPTTKATTTSTTTASKVAQPQSNTPSERYRTPSDVPADDATIPPSLGKHGRRETEDTPSKMKRELLRLQDTDEFAHRDARPVLQTVWSKGKLVAVDNSRQSTRASTSGSTPAPATRSASTPTPASSAAPAVTTTVSESTAPPKAKRQKTEGTKSKDKPKGKGKEPEVVEPELPRRRIKKYLERGLYAGQPTPSDFRAGLSPIDRKELAKHPELQAPPTPNSVLPGPMLAGLKLMVHGRDYKLPFDVCHPNATQPKPDEWRNMSKNRFIGDAKDVWKKIAYTDSSKCVCKPEDKCGESCQNRSMLYECDDTNCNVGREHCTNRAFADLAERRNRGNKYRIGVEVVRTDDRGYGVRSNRCFTAGQIIMEYNGEIITEAECERRMNEEYKDNECYYLMSFDQNMIIDATTGSIARFVNHSCNPNCQMIKWIVAGQPRVALFAGGSPIKTGDELTYDYNFDPFSAKNVQRCLCGEPNCRGVLGPRPREPKPPKTIVKAVSEVKDKVKGAVKAGKRKLKELIGDEDDDDDEDEEEKPSHGAKRRKVQAATSDLKRSISNAGTKISKSVAKVTAQTVRTTVEPVSNAKTVKAQSKTLKTTTKTTTTTATAIKPTRGSSRQSTMASTAASSTLSSLEDTPEPPSNLRMTPTRKRAMTEKAKESIEQGPGRSGIFACAPTPSEEGDNEEEKLGEDKSVVSLHGRSMRSVSRR